MKLPVSYGLLTWSKRKLVRAEYVRVQNGLCYYCKCQLNNVPALHILRAKIDWNRFPKKFQDYPIHLHHCHKTGMTIGAVHARCNAYLWQYKGE